MITIIILVIMVQPYYSIVWPLDHPPPAHLDQHLAQEGHDEGGVHAAEASDGADGQLPDLKHLVVQRHEQRLQVLRLRQVGVEALIQRRQHAVADVRVCQRRRRRRKMKRSLLTWYLASRDPSRAKGLHLSA